MNKKRIRSITGSYQNWLIETLKDKKKAVVYLESALNDYQIDNDKQAFLLALKDVAEAQGGLTTLAKKTKLSRENLYRVLSARGNPRLDTLGLILRAMGMQFSIHLGEVS